MEQLWWHLPGPARFLDSVEQDLRDGKSVVLALPAHHPRGLREALAARVCGNELWAWRTLDLAEEGHSCEPPTDVLHRRFTPLRDGVPLLTAHSIAVCEQFRGLVIWLAGVDEGSWPKWRSFLMEYEHACRSVPETDRPLFCVPLVGSLASSSPVDAVALSVRPWRAIVDRLDMAMFVAHLLGRRPLTNLQRKLAVAVGVELASTDQLLAVELAQTDLSRLLTPLPLLQRFANVRGWTRVQVSRPQWEKGMVDDLEGSPTVHSAALACN